MKHRILIVDDDSITVKLLSRFVESTGAEPFSAGSIAEGLEALKKINPSLILLDLKLPDGTGIDLIPKIRDINEEIPIIMISGSGETGDIVAAMKAGASDYIQKPVDISMLREKMTSLLEMRDIESKTRELLEKDRQGLIVGSSVQMKRLIRQIGKISNSEAPVLILGESGTGKSMVAELIHECSNRKGKPFVNINCAAISPNLLESELFGHVRGAFTGAVSDKQGKFEAAGTGTIFLDEIGEITTDLQVKLLRILQGKEFEKVGSIKTQRAEARVIAATNRNLEEAIAKGSFREDLFYRLNVLPLYIPSLRERKDDIRLLTEHFFHLCCEKEGKRFYKISDDVMEQLENYDWPGNIRELQNVVERAVVLGREPNLKASDFVLGQVSHSKEAQRSGKISSIRDIEYNTLVKALEESGGNISKASKILGISRDTIYRRLKKYNIELK